VSIFKKNNNTDYVRVNARAPLRFCLSNGTIRIWLCLV